MLLMLAISKMTYMPAKFLQDNGVAQMANKGRIQGTDRPRSPIGICPCVRGHAKVSPRSVAGKHPVRYSLGR